MTDPTNCVIGQRPHAADPGLMVCGWHRDELGRLLRSIEDEAIHLEMRPSMAIRYDRSGGGLASEQAPTKLDVLAMLDVRTKPWERRPLSAYRPAPPKGIGPWCLMCDHETCTAWRAGRRRDLHDDEHDAGSDRLHSVLGVLHTWANGVRETRHLTPPATVTLTGERDFLTRNLDWICAQLQAADFHAKLKALLASLRRVTGNRPQRPLTRCVLPTDDGLCGGNVWVQQVDAHAWRVLPDRCERQPVSVHDGPAICDTCGASWITPADKARLSLMVQQAADERARPRTHDGRPMLTATELVDRGLVSSVSNVRVTAHRRGVAAVNGYYDPQAFGEKVAQ
jgi:hypothetical protein